MVKEGVPAVTIDYVVDGLNRRMAKKVDGTVVRRWLWAGPLRIMAELDENGYVLKRFVYGTKVNVPEYMHTYDPVTHEQSGTYRIITDQLGSLRLVVNLADGSIAQRMRHDEWGNVLEDSSPGFTPFGFAGGLYDPDTELVRFGARDYDPETGRWMGKDPMGFKGGDFGLFNYASADPINLTDILGLKLRYANDSSYWAINPYIEQLMQNPLGRMLLSALEKIPQTLLLTYQENVCQSELNPDLGDNSVHPITLDLDPDNQPVVNNFIGESQATPLGTLAHELGHAYFVLVKGEYEARGSITMSGHYNYIDEARTIMTFENPIAHGGGWLSYRNPFRP